ncbi:fasciclin domain-containing protein [Coleofasciculus sp.]|uniref:fasciclin domain-containing protein n=1 Tax=Coleofasciculus sp. TaxID=3100458 RepID=UPI003A2FFD12
MPARSFTSTLRKLTACLGLASLGTAIALPANSVTDSPRLLKAEPGLHLIAQRGVRNIADELETADDAFSTLTAAIKTAGLTSALAGRRPITIFAPTDEAFDNLPDGTVATLLQPQNRSRLTEILTYHVVPGNINTFGLTPGSTLRLTTLAGKPVTIRVSDASEVSVNGVPVVMADIPAANGMIHGISGVLLP